jgi:hypothetical protein
MGESYKGGKTAEVTESLSDYTTFASLPKRLNEVFLKVSKKLRGLDKPILGESQFGSPDPVRTRDR